MARHMSATRDSGRATFLLEVALDRARMKTRLARLLFEERVKRGGGDAHRFAQPEMARLIGYSARQYQRLENADDPSLPGWRDLERIMEKLDLDPSAIFSEEENEPEVSAPTGDGQADRLEAQIARLIGLLEAEQAQRADQPVDAEAPSAR
jgi:transcriptional regulator with XRE-family HTH domain